MVSGSRRIRSGPGLHAPARFLLAALLLGGGAGVQAQAVPQPSQPQQTAPTPPPDALTAAKLVWTTMAAVDHANQTGNYSVLRDLGAPSFQANNNAATLAGIFQNIRTQRLDLSNTLIVAPTYEIPPTVLQGNVLRIRGVFPLRPVGIAFDLLFQPVAGRWALLGISVGPAQAPAAPPPAPPRR